MTEELLEQTIAMLRKLEWSGEYYGDSECYVCGGGKGFHEPNCELAALIVELENLL